MRVKIKIPRVLRKLCGSSNLLPELNTIWGRSGRGTDGTGYCPAPVWWGLMLWGSHLVAAEQKPQRLEVAEIYGCGLETVAQMSGQLSP